MLAQTDCGLIFTGQVIDNHDDQPLVGAVIKLGEQVAVTNVDGMFAFNNICPNTYSISISHIDCETLQQVVNVNSSINQSFYLEHHEYLIKEIEVEATAKRGELSRATRTVTEEEVRERQGGTFGELLKDVDGVSLLKTGSTITKPVIQGLHSQRVLTINNGIRMEGQEWGLEHAPTIDPYAVQQVSVIKGAGAVEYGSDGIGGIVLVEPALLPDKYGTNGILSTAFFSNGRGGNLNATVSGKQKILNLPLSFVLQGSLKKHGNLKAPDYYLNNTGVGEQNFSLRTGYVGDQFGLEGQISQYNSKLGILSDSHIGNENDLRAAIERGRPLFDFGFRYGLSRPRQKILHEIGQVKAYWKSPLGKLTAEYGRQYNRRSEYDLSDIVPGLDLKTETFSFQSSLEYDVNNQLKGKTGIQIISQDYRFSGFYLIPEYQQEAIGAFTTHQYNLNDRVTLEAGLRYDKKDFNYQILLDDLELIDIDAIQLKSTYTTSSGANIGEAERSFSNLWTGSAGITYNVSDATALSSFFGLSARQPLPNELYSDGIHHGTALWEVGKPDLKVEKATSVQLNATVEKDSYSGTITTYLNSIKDYIYPYPKAGAGGFINRIQGSFPIQFTNQSDVMMLGVDYRLSNKFLDDRLLISTGGAFLHAQDRDIDQPVILMPSNRLNHSAEYAIKDNLLVGLRLQNVFEQKRVPSVGFIQDYDTPPSGYSLLDLTASYQTKFLKKKIELSTTTENLLNTKYRDYLDRFRYYVDSPGINFGFRVNYFLM